MSGAAARAFEVLYHAAAVALGVWAGMWVFDQVAF